MTTNEPPDERAEALANVREPSKLTVGLVFAGVAANAATQFAIQAYMSYRFSRNVWGIPQPLCVAVIAALDLFAVVFMVFTYLLRQAKWYTQLYVWIVFAAGVGAQLFAAEQYGAHMEWAGPVRAFAALPALFLAASLHGLVLWRNHSAGAVEGAEPRIGAWVYRAWTEEGECIYIGATTNIEERFRSHKTTAEWWAQAANITRVAYATFDEAVAVERAAIKAERPRFNRQHNPDLPKLRSENAAAPLASSVRRTERRDHARKTGTTGPTPVRRGSPGREEGIRRVLAGEDTATVAADLGVSRRAVQIWMKKAPTVSAEPQLEGSPSAELDILAATEEPQVNGRVFVPTEQGAN